VIRVREGKEKKVRKQEDNSVLEHSSVSLS